MDQQIDEIIKTKVKSNVISNFTKKVNKLTYEQINQLMNIDKRRTVQMVCQYRKNYLEQQSAMLDKVAKARTMIESGVTISVASKKVCLSYQTIFKHAPDLKRFKSGRGRKSKSEPVTRKTMHETNLPYIQKMLYNYRWNKALKIESHFFDNVEVKRDPI